MLKKIDEADQVPIELLGILQFRTRVFFAAIPSNRPKSLSHRTKKRCLSHIMLSSSSVTYTTCGGRYFLWDRLLIRISHEFTRTAQGQRPERPSFRGDSTGIASQSQHALGTRCMV